MIITGLRPIVEEAIDREIRRNPRLEGEALERKIANRLTNLNDLVSHVCHSILVQGSEDSKQQLASSYIGRLGYWCLEKTLDNAPWNSFHLDRLKQLANGGDEIEYYQP